MFFMPKNTQIDNERERGEREDPEPAKVPSVLYCNSTLHKKHDGRASKNLHTRALHDRVKKRHVKPEATWEEDGKQEGQQRE
jgi:hypothetical protein